jgi:hypothetical protein
VLGVKISVGRLEVAQAAGCHRLFSLDLELTRLILPPNAKTMNLGALEVLQILHLGRQREIQYVNIGDYGFHGGDVEYYPSHTDCHHRVPLLIGAGSEDVVGDALMDMAASFTWILRNRRHASI